jgi:quercetin dioxygenase-like cupin family protein
MAKVLGPADGKRGQLPGMGVRFMIGAEESGGGLSLVEHPMPPRALGAPLHRHTHEDEYSYVLEGRVGAQLGDQVVFAEPGDLIFKPRREWHSFWNAGDEPARILEIISPGGFEGYFEELAALPAGPPDPGRIAEIAARYDLELDVDSIPRLAETYGLQLGPVSPPAALGSSA